MAHSYNIQKVSLGATSEEAFQFATKMCFSTGMLVSVCRDRVLVKKGELFSMPENFSLPGVDKFDTSIFHQLRVLDCEPVHQGAITVNTQFTVIDISQVDKSISQDTKDVLDLLPLHILVSDFTSHLNSMCYDPPHSKSTLGTSTTNVFEAEAITHLSPADMQCMMEKCDINGEITIFKFTRFVNLVCPHTNSEYNLLL